jgi:protein pelota
MVNLQLIFEVCKETKNIIYSQEYLFREMQIIKKNLKQGEVVVKVNSPEDLWFLNQVTDIGDAIKGKTERKVKIGKEDERKKAIVKKTILIEISVEKKEFHKYSDNLRINGVIIQGVDDVPKGSHHTFDIEPGSIITITKKNWPNYQLEKLKEATQQIKTRIIALLFDREEALFAMLKNHGYEILAKLKGEVAKKSVEGAGKDFYKDIIGKLIEYNKRFEPQNIIIASPSFWKEYLMKEMPDELKQKITLSTCSEVDETAIAEVLQRPELLKVLEHDRAAKELSLVEEVLKAIAQNEACYGLADCKEKIGIGAVKELLVSYSFINKAREESKHMTVEAVMRLAEDTGAKVHILSTEEAEQKLVGLGGMAGILRWKIQ